MLCYINLFSHPVLIYAALASVIFQSKLKRDTLISADSA